MSRDLPSSPSAERAVIGSLVLYPHAWQEASALLGPADFLEPMLGLAWRAFGELAAQQAPITPVSLAESMRAHTAVSVEEIEARLMSLAAEGGIPDTIAHHARIVREHTDRRRLILLCQEQAARAYAGDVPADEIVSAVASGVLDISTGRPSEAVSLRRAAIEALDVIEARAEADRSGRVGGVTFGLRALDDLLSGVAPGELCVIAGSAGGGKSSLACQAVIETARAGGTGLVLSMEMPRALVGERAIALHGVDGGGMRTGRLDLDGWRAAQRAAQQLPEHVYVDDRRTDIATAGAKARRWRSQHPSPRVGVVALDFVQLIKLALGRGLSLAAAVGEIAYTCKGMAKELECAMLLVAQLNRSAAQEHEAPDLHHLKDSSGIEQAADQVVFIHNPDRTEDGPVEIHVAKNRSGPRRRVMAHWTGRHYRFTDLIQDQQPPQVNIPWP